MSTIFISYSSKDQHAAEAVLRQLESWGYVEPFLSADSDTGILVGSDWMAALHANLRRCDALVFLCSDHSMQSAWCLAELVQAHAGGKFIAPVVIAPYDAARAFSPMQKLIAERQVADLTQQGDAYERLRKALEVNGIDSTDDFPWDKRREPYPGMLAFDEADAAIYFGRGPEIKLLLDRLGRMRVRETKVAVVVGESGSGKSSFVRAGIIPRLRKDRTRWVIVPPFRPKDAPIDELARALSDALAIHGRPTDWREIRSRLDRPTAEAAAALIDLARDLTAPPPAYDGTSPTADASVSGDASVLLMVDQLEELLAPERAGVADAFLRLMRDALGRPGTPLVVIATLRADFLGALQRQPALEGLPREIFPLDNMPATRVPDIIEGPARRIDFKVEDGLVERMAGDMNVDALPLLAFTLRELYGRCRELRRLTLSAYEEIGGINGAVAKSLADTLHLERLPAAEQAALRHAFLYELSTLSDDGERLTRRPALWNDIPEAARPILDRLVEARLLVRGVDKDDRPTVEVAHEALFRTWNTLAQWVGQDRNFLLWRRRFRTRLEADELLGPKDLRLVRRYRHEDPSRFNPGEQTFIHRSVLAQWRARIPSGLMALGLIALVAGAGWYYWRTNSAQELVAASQNALKSNPEKGIRLAVAAVDQWAAENSWEALRQALLKSHVRAILQQPNDRSTINVAAFGPDPYTVLTASADGTARVWAIDASLLDPTRLPPAGVATEPASRLTVTDPQKPVRSIGSAALSPTGSRLVSAAGFIATVWDMNGQSIGTLDHGWLVNSVAFGCDDTLVLTADRHGTARLWTPDSGAVVPLEGHRKSINSARFDRDCTRVVTASDDGTARVWSRATGTLIAELNGHKAPVINARFSPDGRLVVTASSDGTSALWAADSGVKTTPSFEHEAALRDARLSPDGHHLITVGDKGTARWWNVDNHESRELQGPSNLVAALDISPRGQWFVTAGDDGVARVWSTATGAQIANLRGHTRPITSAAFSPDGNYVVTAAADGSARVWAVGTDADSYVLPELSAPDADPYSVAFAPDGSSLVTGVASAGSDGAVLSWVTGAQEPSTWLARFDGVVHQAALSTGGAFLIAAVEGGGAHVFQRDGERWKEATDPIDAQASMLSAAVSADGLKAATAVNRQPARLWKRSAADRSWQQDVAVDLPIAQSVAFSADDRYLVVAGDQSAVVLNLATEQEPVRFEGHTKPLNSARFSPRGDRLVTASADTTARIWDVKTRAMLQTLSHTESVQDAVFSADGSWVATVAGTEAQVWDVATGAHLQPPFPIPGTGRSVAFSPDDRLLAVAVGDKTIRLFQWEGFAPHADLLAEVSRRRIPSLSGDDRKRYLAERPGRARQLLARLFGPTPP